MVTWPPDATSNGPNRRVGELTLGVVGQCLIAEHQDGVSIHASFNAGDGGIRKWLCDVDAGTFGGETGADWGDDHLQVCLYFRRHEALREHRTQHPAA